MKIYEALIWFVPSLVFLAYHVGILRKRVNILSQIVKELSEEKNEK